MLLQIINLSVKQDLLSSVSGPVSLGTSLRHGFSFPHRSPLLVFPFTSVSSLICCLSAELLTSALLYCRVEASEQKTGEELSVQLEVFDEQKASDDDQLPAVTTDGLDLSSHPDIFSAIMKQVSARWLLVCATHLVVKQAAVARYEI